MFIEVWRYLMNIPLPVGSLSASMMLESNKTDPCQSNVPFYIIPSHGSCTEYLFSELSTQPQMSDIIWLLFIDKNCSVEELFSNINIPFDCEFLVAQQEDENTIGFAEVYRVSPRHPLQTQRFGKWTSSDGLSLPSASFYKRRRNLQGLILITGTKDVEPVRFIKQIDKKPVEIGGYFGDMWNIAQTRLNFSSDYYTPKDNAFGALQDDGSWNGMIAMLVRKEVDIVVSGLSWTLPRTFAVDFIAPTLQFRVLIYIKAPDIAEVLWESFLTPFSPGFRLLVIVVVAVLSITLWLMDQLRYRFMMMAGARTNRTFIRSLLQVFRMFCSQACHKMPEMVSYLIFLLTIYLTGVVMFTSYAAALLSHVMTMVYKVPFNNLQELLDDGAYRLEVLASSSDLDYFKKSSHPMVQRIYNRHIATHESSFPNTIIEGLERVCSQPNYAFMIAEVLAVSYFGNLSCRLNNLPTAFITEYASTATQKGSPYRDILKHTFHDMHRSGLLQVLHKKHWLRNEPTFENKFSSVLLSQVTPVLAILAAGVIISTFLFTVEHLSKCYKRKTCALHFEFTN